MHGVRVPMWQTQSAGPEAAEAELIQNYHITVYHLILALNLPLAYRTLLFGYSTVQGHSKKQFHEMHQYVSGLPRLPLLFHAAKPKKSSERSCLCAGCDKEEQVAPQRLLRTHLTFTKSVMLSMGVPKLGPMDLVFIDKWRSMAHTAVRWFWLKSYCLSCVRSVESSLSFSKAMFLLTERARQSTFWNETLAFISPDLWPPISTDLNSIDYKIWHQDMHSSIIWCNMYFDILNRLGVDHKCDRQTHRQTDWQTV